MLTLDVVPGVHRVQHASTCCYLVESEGQVVLVDGGFPATHGRLGSLLERLGLGWPDLDAIVLTHAHFDHLGVCAGLEKELGIRTWVHAGDARIARHPYRYRPGRPRLLYPVAYPRSLRHLGAMTAAGALAVRGVEEPQVFDDDGPPLPGALVAVPTPGHTDGHVALHLPAVDAVLNGDALVTLAPYTGRTGPRIVARAGTKDRETALGSLRAIAATGATHVLPGHGEPWSDGVEWACAEAA